MAKRKRVKSASSRTKEKSTRQKNRVDNSQFFYKELLKLSGMQTKVKTKSTKDSFIFKIPRKKRTRSELKDVIASLPFDEMQKKFPDVDFANITLMGNFEGKIHARTFSISSDDFYDELYTDMDSFIDSQYDNDLNYVENTK